jgi:hypothetical protein
MRRFGEKGQHQFLSAFRRGLSVHRVYKAGIQAMPGVVEKAPTSIACSLDCERVALSDRGIEERPYLLVIIDISGRNQLRQIDHDHLLLRVDPVG